jgi:hypothetical protein
VDYPLTDLGVTQATTLAARPATDLPNCGLAELELWPAPGGVTGTLNQWPLRLTS